MALSVSIESIAGALIGLVAGLLVTASLQMTKRQPFDWSTFTASCLFAFAVAMMTIWYARKNVGIDPVIISLIVGGAVIVGQIAVVRAIKAAFWRALGVPEPTEAPHLTAEDMRVPLQTAWPPQTDVSAGMKNSLGVKDADHGSGRLPSARADPEF